MPKDNQEEERIVEELTLELSYGGRGNLLDDTMGMDTVRNLIRTTLTTYGNTRELAGVEKCIKLSDEIELREPDGGTRQWMAFKAFRNTMRDRVATIKSELK
jgi:hypothetical protein